MKTLNLKLILPVFWAITFCSGSGAEASLSSSIRVRINSSANAVYPCNAGIAQNPKSVAKGVDFVRGTWTASEHNPKAIAGSGMAVGGVVKDNNPDTDYALLSSIFGSDGRSYLSYNQLLPEATQYDYVIGSNSDTTRLEINLASDTYDSGYYITFCFNPSRNDNTGVPMLLKFTSARATHSVVPGVAYNYATDSGLKSMLEIKCRKDGEANAQHYTPNGVASIESLLTPFTGNTTIDMVPTGGIEIGETTSLISGTLLPVGALPDDCRVRYYFIETAEKLRPHVLTSSDIQLDLDVSVSAMGM